MLEFETIEGKHIHEILEHGKIISEIVKPSEPSDNTDDPDNSKEKVKDSAESKPDHLEPGTEAIGAPA